MRNFETLFNRYHIVLETRDGFSTTNRIILEEEVLAGLDRYREQVKRFYQELRETGQG